MYSEKTTTVSQKYSKKNLFKRNKGQAAPIHTVSFCMGTSTNVPFLFYTN
jgi:hypothetical protein